MCMCGAEDCPVCFEQPPEDSGIGEDETVIITKDQDIYTIPLDDPGYDEPPGWP